MGKEDLESNTSDLMQQKADDVDTRTDIDRELERVEGIESDAEDILDDEDDAVNMAANDQEDVPVRRIDGISQTTAAIKPEKEVSIAKDKPVKEENTPLIDKMRAEMAVSAKRAEKQLPKRSSGSKSVLVSVLMSLLAFAAIGAAGWLFLQKIDSDNKITNLEQQLRNREQELTQKPKTTPVKNTTQSPENTVRFSANGAVVNGYRMIPEWTMRYKATDGSQDISFAVEPLYGGETMKVRSLSLMRAKPADLSNGAIDSCKAYSEDGTLAIVRRMTKATYDDLMAMPETIENKDVKKNVKKLGDWYFAFIPVDERCISSKQKDQDIWKSGKKELDSLMQTIEVFTQQ